MCVCVCKGGAERMQMFGMVSVCLEGKEEWGEEGLEQIRTGADDRQKGRGTTIMELYRVCSVCVCVFCTCCV